MTKIQKNLEWLRLYLDSVKDLISLKHLTSVKGFKVPLHKQENVHGSILRIGPWYNITLRTTLNNYNTNKQNNTYIATILETLAHELAHMQNWEHTPEHFLLQAKILSRFAIVLKKQNINDTYKRISK